MKTFPYRVTNRTKILFLFFLAIALPCSARRAGAQTSPQQMKGIYAVNTISRGLISSAILTDPYVTGVFLSLGWSDLQSTEGSYTWSKLDTWVSQATASGKKVSLGVMAGYRTPSWVYLDGAQSFSFVWDKTNFGPALCSVQKAPIPWDSVFQAKWKQFVQDLGARYGSNLTISSIMLAGVNYVSIETSLPATVDKPIRNSAGTVSCTGYDYPTNWQKAGYTRTKIENGLFQMTSEYAHAFPNAQVVAGMNPGGFPPIDQNGNLIASQPADYQANLDLLDYGIANLGSGFSAANGGLSATWVWSLLVQNASIVDVGYQTVSKMGTKLGPTVDLGLASGARWLELWTTDIMDPTQKSVIQSTYTALL